MNYVIRQMITGVVFSILISGVVLGISFSVFPIESIAALWTTEAFDIPFLIFITSFVIGCGLVGGFSYGWYWKRRLHSISNHLDDLLNGHPLNVSAEETVPEFIEMERQLQKVESKWKKQAEAAQRLATERANEREQSLQEVVAQERNRLARELHDSVSQQLFAASMMMSAINDANPPKDVTLKKQMAMVEDMIQQSQLEMRALLLHLRPVALKGKSLQEGMEELLQELTHKVPMTIDWKIEAITLDKGIEDQLFRILQEAVSNTLRHAKATSLHTMLIQRDQFVILRITDDGVGFHVEEQKTSSYGMQNMQERSMEIGGTLKVISVPNQGTRLEVKVPYVNREEMDDD
ncbi:sensor histidine kinase [Pontibacillus salicampi]|uniref:Sensor histidine kinase n=1 Tax=Pontibacillus salicampi TaxID=1449801 RepID=A0ABV6LKD8_9BACI